MTDKTSSTSPPFSPPPASAPGSCAVPAPKLTLRQQRFVDAYLGEARGNATEAARVAGYAKPMQEGWRLLRKAEIHARIDEVLRSLALSREEVLALLAADARRSDEEILATAREANSVPAEAATISALVSARTTARTNLAKAHGLFTENLNISGSLTREYVIVREGD